MIVTRREKTRKREINLFLYSIVYLLALFSIIILEGLTGLNTL
jgi:heme O synthase-like polyprenyltransferase